MNHYLGIIHRNYGIRPTSIEQISDHVYLIHDHYQKYGWKKSSLTNEKLGLFESVYRKANQHGLREILPIFQTTYGELFVNDDGIIYYLYPWISTTRQMKMKELYQTIGNIHQKTKRNFRVSKEEFVESFKQYLVYCKTIEKNQLAVVKVFEANRYMSPFELQVCTYFRDIRYLSRRLIHKIEQLVDEVDEEIEWSTSLCHHDLTLSNTIGGEVRYIFNWEKARFDHAIYDLVHLYLKEFTRYHSSLEPYKKHFHTYMEKHQLSNIELTILGIHLLNPSKYVELVDEYINHSSNRSMLQQTKELQAQHRLLSYNLQLVDFIDDEFEEASFDQDEN